MTPQRVARLVAGCGLHAAGKPRWRCGFFQVMTLQQESAFGKTPEGGGQRRAEDY